MNLRNKMNEDLVKELKDLVRNERQLLMEILYRLREVEERKLHLQMGYPDIYRFTQDALGYSSSAAYRRVAAMRLLKAIPELDEKLESGELGLENASRAETLFRKEDKKRCKTGEQKMAASEKQEIVGELLGKSTRDAERILSQRLPDVAEKFQEKIRPLADGKTLIQFAASPELMAKLEELKGLLAHSNFEGSMNVLVEKLADSMLKKLKPQSRKIIPAPEKTDSRYIPASEKKKVKERDARGCTYRDPSSGRQCGSRHGLQFDHIEPFSRGGSSTADNLTLLCGAHNRYRAEKMGIGGTG
jgi:5-methylcytosine-specific restriction endonuclease McrA